MGCSSKCGKTCHDKSCQRYYNNNPQSVATNSTLQLAIAGSKVVDSGISIETEPQSYTVLKTGLYHLVGDVVFQATAVGEITLQIYMDGVALPCTLKNLTVDVGYNSVHTETDLCLTACCCDIDRTFTYALTTDGTATGNVVEFCSGILKLA